uniref:Uncharacterized protein n=1 Tax=Arundo donax TaxID=35708 RepID=A0A0A9FPG1_ARUDO
MRILLHPRLELEQRRPFKVDRRAAIHGEVERQPDERHPRRNEAIHPAHPFFLQARDERETTSKAPSHDPLREPLEQSRMHGQRRGPAAIAPAAATIRAPP